MDMILPSQTIPTESWDRVYPPGTLIRVGGSGRCGRCTRFNLYQIGGGQEKVGCQTTNELSGISKLVEKDNKVSKEEERIEEAESDFEDDDDDGSDEQRRLRNRSGPFRRLTVIRSELYY